LYTYVYLSTASKNKNAVTTAYPLRNPLGIFYQSPKSDRRCRFIISLYFIRAIPTDIIYYMVGAKVSTVGFTGLYFQKKKVNNNNNNITIRFELDV